MKNKKLWLSVPSVAMAITVALCQPTVAFAMEETEAQEVTETQEASEENASAVVIVVQGTEAADAEEDVEEVDSEEEVQESDAEDADVEDIDAEDTDVEYTDVEDTDLEDTDVEYTDVEDTDVEDTDVEDTDVDDTDDMDDDIITYDPEDEVPSPGYPDGPDSEVSDDIVDAEKYGTEGYDSNLCWAASAADVLWSAGYPQHAINPLTNEVFQSEDEVFDFFRTCFTDEGGDQEAAFLYFIDGEYPNQGDEGFSQLKETAPDGGFIPEISAREVVIADYEDGDLSTDIFESYETLVPYYEGAATLDVGFWDESKLEYTGAHAITLLSLEKDEAGNYTGIWIVDSDNDKYYEGVAETDAEKAQAAAGAPNSCQYYLLSAKEIDNGYYWTIDDYSEGDDTVITAIRYLMEYNPELFATINDGEIVIGGSGEGTPSNSITEEAFTAIRNMMADAGWAIYSPSNTIYDATKDTGYSVFVSRPASDLLNVYVDGQRLSAGAGEFKLYVSPSGVYSLTIDTSIMRALESGEHTLTLDMNAGEDIVTTINVQ